MSGAVFGGISLIFGSVIAAAFLWHGAREITRRNRALERGESGL